MCELGRLSTFALAKLHDRIEHDRKDNHADHRNDVHDQHMQVVLHACDLCHGSLQVQGPFGLNAGGHCPQNQRANKS